MAKKIDPRDFLLNTDYEMDKIIYYTIGEMTPGYKAIPHKLGFTPLAFGVSAFNSDFSDSRMSPYMSYSPDVNFSITANNTYIMFNYTNNTTPNQKLFYRIYGFEPAGESHNVGPTTKNAKKFIVNTDYNYCKLYRSGVATGDTTIEHNFGYIPLVLAWDYASFGSDFYWLSTDTDYISVTPTTVKIKVSDSNNKIQYRIYYDEA